MTGDVFYFGLGVMAFIYISLLLLAWIGPRLRKGHVTEDLNSTDLFLAGRSIPLWMAIFTMTATWVGGGYLAGTAEAVFNPDKGQGWAQAGWGYALSLVFGGLIYAKKMREYNYTTMLDAFTQKFGEHQTTFLYIFALMGEVMWTGAIMTALGAAFSTILGINMTVSIILTAAITIGYTVISGLWAVAYTDVAQLVMVTLFLTIAAFIGIEAVGGWDHAWAGYDQAFGTQGSGFLVGYFAPVLYPKEWGNWTWTWLDYGLLYIFGGIPWHCYFQRVLASKNGNVARWMSVGAGVIAFFAVIPPTLIAVVGHGFEWDAAQAAVLAEKPTMVLPYVLRYCVPPLIGALGLGAIAAAVMSSVDSSVLSASSMFTWNVYKKYAPGEPSDAQLKKVLRTTIIVVGVAATIISLQVKSVYTLWYFNCDLVYVTLFPALTAALFVKSANRIGLYAGVAVALVLRMIGGIPEFGINPLFNYWIYWTDPDGLIYSQFPFRTSAMVAGLVTIIVVSKLTRKQDPARELYVMEIGGEGGAEAG